MVVYFASLVLQCLNGTFSGNAHYSMKKVIKENTHFIKSPGLLNVLLNIKCIGLRMCKFLKNRYNSCHIPVLEDLLFH